jgi:hypothetical protein
MFMHELKQAIYREIEVSCCIVSAISPVYECQRGLHVAQRLREIMRN